MSYGTDHSIVEAHELDGDSWNRRMAGHPDPGAEFVCTVAEALEPDDEIIINSRSRALTVLGFEEQRHEGVIGGSDYPYHILWLRGNGTEYRLRWSHLCEYRPHLHTESQLETHESFSVRQQETTKQTWANCSGQPVDWIRPVDVDEEDVPEWAFARNLDGLEDCTRDTEVDR